MNKFQKVASNLDYGQRKANREVDRIEALRKLQEEEDEARRQKDEAALKRLERRRQLEEQKRAEEA